MFLKIMSRFLLFILMGIFISSCNSGSGSAPDVYLKKIELITSSRTLAKNTSMQIEAKGIYSNNVLKDLTNQVSWSSSNEDVAIIDKSGLLTGLSAGQATISAMINGVTSESIVITVNDAQLISIELDANKLDLAKGTSANITALGKFNDNSTQDLTNQVVWGTTDKNVATVNSSGLISAVSPGLANITASMNNIISNKLLLTVTDAQLVSISLSLKDSMIAKGTTTKVTALGKFDNGSTQDITNQVSWTLSKQNIASITGDGLISALSVGETSIEAEMNGVTSSNLTFTVTNAVLKSLTMQIESNLIPVNYKGEIYQVIGRFSDNSIQDLTYDEGLIFNSTDENIAVVYDRAIPNSIEANEVGNTNISVTYYNIDEEGYHPVVTSTPIKITVTNATLSSISIAPIVTYDANSVQIESNVFTAFMNYYRLKVIAHFNDGTTLMVSPAFVRFNLPRTTNLEVIYGTLYLNDNNMFGDVTLTASFNGYQIKGETKETSMVITTIKSELLSCSSNVSSELMLGNVYPVSFSASYKNDNGQDFTVLVDTDTDDLQWSFTDENGVPLDYLSISYSPRVVAGYSLNLFTQSIGSGYLNAQFHGINCTPKKLSIN